MASLSSTRSWQFPRSGAAGYAQHRRDIHSRRGTRTAERSVPAPYMQPFTRKKGVFKLFAVARMHMCTALLQHA